VAAKAKVIKINDLAKVIDSAVAASAGNTKIPGGIIMGRSIAVKSVGAVDANALARNITKQVQASVSGYKLTPKVIIDGGFITIGFIAREILAP